jgi:2-oxoglutarate ferredoxin oxidoreductase subunit beta
MLEATETIASSPETKRTYFVENPRFPFCKGCGHTNVLRRLNDALVALQIPPQRIALVTDIGCIGLADGLFAEVHTVHTTHGRSTAFASGIALADAILADRKLKTIVLIGDGGAMIGLQHLIHAAALNVDVTVLICNNFVYGMTGGQGSGLTPECFVTATTPKGNIVPPVDLCEILKHSNAPFVARAMATDAGLAAMFERAISFKGFSAVEVLELCTEFAVPQNELTGKKLVEIAREHRWEFGVLRDDASRPEFAERYVMKPAEDAPRVETSVPARRQAQGAPAKRRPVSILIAGSAGERVQSAASVFCQAAIESGLHVTQKNDNPVTQGSGFSVSEVWMSSEEIGFTGIEQPEYVVVTSSEGYRELESRGWFSRLTEDTVVVVDSTIGGEFGSASVVRLPVRSTFGLRHATQFALVILSLRFNLLPTEQLESVLFPRYGNEWAELLKKARDLTMLE